MTGLVLELKADEVIRFDGVSIRFRSKARVEINGPARFLFGKQILAASEARTPAAQIYLALQEAYIGVEAGRAHAMLQARAAAEGFKTETVSERDRRTADQMIVLAEAGLFYEALKLARGLMRQEMAAAIDERAAPLPVATTAG